MYVSELLTYHVKNKKINIKKCAEYFQMDRSSLYKIFRGERNVPNREFILKISQYLYLTNDEKKELLTAYEIDDIGEFRYYCRKHVESFLKEATFIDNTPLVETNNSVQCELRTGYYTNKYDIEQLISNLFLFETKEEEPHIKIMKQPYHDLYHLKTLSKISPNIPITHIFCLDNTDELTQTNHFYNLTCFTNIMPLIFNNICYRGYYYYNEINTRNNHLDFFPNVIITKQYLFIYTDDHSSGILYPRGDTYNAYLKQFDVYLDQTSPLITLNKDSETLNENLNVLLSAPYIETLLYTQDSLHKILKQDILSNQFINTFKKQSETIKLFIKKHKDQFTSIYTVQGLRYFVNTGYINAFPTSLCNPLSINDRISILRRQKNFMAAHSTYLADIPEFPDSSSLIILTNVHTFCFQIVSPHGVTMSMECHETSLVNAFNDYYKFVSSEKCFSQEDAFKIIDTYISQLEAMKKGLSRNN